MKRLLICSFAVPWPAKPLLGVFHAFQARALAKLGVEVRLFAPSPALPRAAAALSRRARGHRKRPTNYEIHGVRVYAPRVRFVFPRFVRFGLAEAAPSAIASWARRAIGSALWDVVEDFRPDALVMHGAMPWGPLVAQVAAEFGIPSGIIEHSAVDLTRIREPDSPLAEFYRDCASRARATFAVGPQVVAHARAVVGLRDMRLLTNGVEPADLATIAAARPRELRGRFVILGAGNYYRRKGFEELLAAFVRALDRLPNSQLDLVTRLPRSVRRKYRPWIENGRVVVHPPCGTGVLRRRMAQADVFALPAWDEAFGLVYAEAASVGTPVVMTRDNGFAHTLELQGCAPSEIGWVVDARDVSSIARALQVAHIQRRRLDSNVVDFVEEHFSWERNARQLLAGLAG